MKRLSLILIVIVSCIEGKTQDPVLLTKYFIDSAKALNVMTVTIRENAPDSSVWGSYKLDTNGRIIEMKFFDIPELVKYDKYDNRIFNSKNKRKYNTKGKIIWEQSTDLDYTVFHYDTLDRLMKEEFFLSSGKLNQYWNYKYNDEGYLSKIYAYDPPILDSNYKLGTTQTFQYGNWGRLNLYRFEYRMGGLDERRYYYENGLPAKLEYYDYIRKKDKFGDYEYTRVLKTYEFIYEFRK